MHLFPFDFRRNYGGDMEATFRKQHQHAVKSGRTGQTFRLWRQTFGGFLLAAPGEQVDTLRRDVRHGLRSLKKKPAFTLLTIVALAIGIGANIGVFTLANTLLLAPLPVADPERVVRAYANRYSNMDYRDYTEYRDRNDSISDLALFQTMGVSVRNAASLEMVLATVITGNYFRALGVPAVLGRAIETHDDVPGAAGAVMVSDTFWRLRFNRDPNVIGKPITINGSVFTIVGITPAWFTGTMSPLRSDLWLPWNALTRGQPDSGHLIGRLKEETSPKEAQADLSRVANQLAQEKGHPVVVSVYPARTLVPEIFTAVATFIGFLMGIVAVVLLIACLNVGSLLFARSAERSREIAVRIVLGAGRFQVFRQLVTETLILAVGGGVAAAAIAMEAIRVLPSSLPGLPKEAIALNLELDWRVVVFAIATTFVSASLIGFLPAFQAVRTASSEALKEGRSNAGLRRSKLRAAFIVAQVAMSTLLLIVGGLLVRTLTNASTTDRKFNTTGVVAAAINLESAGYQKQRGLVFYESLLNRLEASPGVLSANIVKIVPLTLSNDRYYVQAGTSRVFVSFNAVSRGHFRTLGIPLVQGRDFNALDRDGAGAVGIINEALARRLWPGESAIGKQLDGVAIVGVARDSKYTTATESRTYFLYRPLGQMYVGTANILVKIQGDLTNAASVLRAAVGDLDPDLAVSNIMPLDRATNISLLPVQVAAALAGVLGFLALVLGTVGIYGVVSYLVRQRTREVGIRVALGARPVNVVRLITRQVMMWTGIGLAIGLIAALGVGQLLVDLIYGVGPKDPISFVGITLLLAATAYVACWIPARRASRIDPISALREE
jgi:predicted permease